MRVAPVNPILSHDCEMPLGLLYVADAVERAGHEVRVLDTGFSTAPDHPWPVLAAWQPQVVGFTVTSIAYPRTLALAGEVKRRCGSTTVLGGLGGTHDIEVVGRLPPAHVPPWDWGWNAPGILLAPRG